MPLLLIPSLINRWYIMDLRPGASLVEALTNAGIDTWCLDWGVPHDEERYVSWDELQARIARAARRVRRITGAKRIGVLGYCMGGTLASIHAALHPETIGALVNLAGPIDFSRGGRLAQMVDPDWFDAGAIADAGNVSASQMQSGFAAMRPTLDLVKMVSQFENVGDDETRLAFAALEEWSSDNIAFPAEAYRRYIGDLYQSNQLIKGEHRIAGEPADLSAITAPVLTIVASRDHICPPDAATALNEGCSSAVRDVLTVPGGHVGAVVGRRAATEMYPATTAWLIEHLRS
jgi:polyhydroxyalkanoate synthase